MSSSVANLLDLDAGLAAVLAPPSAGLTPPAIDVRVLRVPAGRWEPPPPPPGRPLGLLVVAGLMLRRVSLGHRTAAELLGTGDLLRPWCTAEPPFTVDWRALAPVRVAVLDDHAAARLARFPSLLLALVERELPRSRRMAERCATAQLGTTEERLRIELSRLAVRWGTPRPEGMALPLSLTHETLGNLIGVRRPAVTTALSLMTRAGEIEPLPGAGWLLRFVGG